MKLVKGTVYFFMDMFYFSRGLLSCLLRGLEEMLSESRRTSELPCLTSLSGKVVVGSTGNTGLISSSQCGVCILQGFMWKCVHEKSGEPISSGQIDLPISESSVFTPQQGFPSHLYCYLQNFLVFQSISSLQTPTPFSQFFYNKNVFVPSEV